MARDTSKLVTIPGELHSAATGNIVAAAEEVFDYTTKFRVVGLSHCGSRYFVCFPTGFDDERSSSKNGPQKYS